jgi:GNAT superfamily N-acetyltransferase
MLDILSDMPSEVLRIPSDCLAPSHLLAALSEFKAMVAETGEMQGALSVTEAKIMITGLIERLMEVALQCARTVKWSTLTVQLIRSLRKILQAQNGWALTYDYQLTQECEYARAHGETASQAVPGEFQLSVLSGFDEGLYNQYIASLKDLITRYDTFESEPKFTVAAQAVRIGRNACVLAGLLYSIMGMEDRAREVRLVVGGFSVHHIIKPIILNQRSVYKFTFHSRHRHTIWDYMRDTHGYTDGDIDDMKGFTIWAIREPFQDLECAFAITNHDVTREFEVPVADAREELRHPIVVVQHMEVHKAFRRCGFGRYLLNFLKSSVDENDYEALSVYEQPSMSSTMPFWRSAGFKPSQLVEGWHEIELSNGRA